MDDQPAINAMIEMTALYTRRPALGAPIEDVIAWYQAKGRMHEHLAACGGADAAQESAYSTASFAHARRLQDRIASADGASRGWAA